MTENWTLTQEKLFCINFIVLNEAHVAQDISVEGFGGMLNNITANNYLAFAEEEIPAEGRGHNKALHVSVK